MIEIVRVSEQEHWHKFFQFPSMIYRHDPLWTPLPEESQRQMFSPQNNPLLQHVQYELFLAMDNGKTVGRIAAITDDYLSDQKIGLFGCFETIDNSEVAQKLLNAAANSLVSKGKRKMQGPVTLNTTQQVGLLVEGFDLPPQMMMPYNPPYYEKLLEEAGCSKLLDLYSYVWRPVITKKSKKLKAVAKRAARIPGIRLRPINLNDPWREGRRLAEIHNQGMTNQWGFVPMDQEEGAYFLAGLRSYADPELLTFCEVENKTIGVFLVIPDIAPQLRADRRPGFHRILNFFRPRSVRVAVLAVLPEYRRRGVVGLLIDQAIDTFVRKGYQQAELSLIMDSNKEVNNIVSSAFGSRVNKTFRIYQKSFDKPVKRFLWKNM